MAPGNQEEEAHEPLESPTSDINQRPKRRKIETEKVRAARDDVSPDDIWSQCDACDKWRKLPPGTTLIESEKWYCHMNADPNFNSCDIPEAAYDQEGPEAVDATEEMDPEEMDAEEMDPEEMEAAPLTEAEAADELERDAADELGLDDDDVEEPQPDDQEDAPYQPPKPGTAGANGGDEELGDIFDDYQSGRPLKHALQGTFLKDLYAMMIGFGDDASPSMETVEFVEDALVSYSVEILKAALDLSKQRGRMRSTGKPTGPPTAEDVVTVVRKDPRKVKRIEELMIMQQEIKVAQDTIEKQVRAVLMSFCVYNSSSSSSSSSSGSRLVRQLTTDLVPNAGGS